MKKKLLLLAFVQLVAFTVKAQLGYNYHEYSLGFGTGYECASTDIPSVAQTAYASLKLNASYNFTPYVNFTLEYQFGRLSGGYNDYYSDNAKGLNPADANYATNSLVISKTYGALDPYYRTYINNYKSIMLQGDVQLGEFADLSEDHWTTKALRNFYIGTGIGMIYNNISNNRRLSPDSTYTYGGSDKSNNVMIPVRVGYQFKFWNAYDEPSVLINVGYQRNYVFGYGLDGYSDPLFVSGKPQYYGGFNIGIRFNFGSVTSYRKPFR